MSAARSTPPGFGLAGLRMRAADYFALGETQDRYELVDGVVMMSPSPRPRHWKAVQEIVLQLALFVRAGGRADVYSETDLEMHDFSVFRPDVCVYAGVSPAKPLERLTAPPDLVIEVLSPGTQVLDMITKRDEYERRGVREYWIIDPADARVRAWRLERGRFIESLVEGDALQSFGITSFALDLRALAKAVGAT